MNADRKQMISGYINTFMNHIAPYVKDTVGIKALVFPFNEGVVLIFEFDFDRPASTEFKKESCSLSDALTKAGVSNPSAAGASVIFDRNRIIEIKPYDCEAWSSTVADDIISHLVGAAIKKSEDKKTETCNEDR